MTFWRIAQRPLPLLALAAAVGCAGGVSPHLEEARSGVATLRSDEDVRSYAELQVDEAQRALAAMERAAQNEASESELEHLGYIVQRRIELARTAAQEAELRQRTEELAERRGQLLLEARTQRARRAEELAEQRAAEAEEARSRAEQFRDEAATAQGRTRDAEARAQALLGELEELKSQQTSRGLVMTLSGVYFATGAAELQAGALRALDRVATVLNEYPERTVSIEGHTDSTGSATLNARLSRERAQTVADYLRTQGVQSSRITARGLGSSAPIASNETAAGRQANRRIEIILNSGSGEDPI